MNRPDCSPAAPPPGAGMLPPTIPDSRPRRSGRVAARGWFAEINAFIDVTLARLTRAEAAVWLVLWRDTKPTGQARVSQADVARRAGVTDRAVRAALAGLREKGLVKVVRRGGSEQGRRSTGCVR